jgi:hypothetical protein
VGVADERDAGVGNEDMPGDSGRRLSGKEQNRLRHVFWPDQLTQGGVLEIGGQQLRCYLLEIWRPDQPEAMRLNAERYFVYYETPPEVMKAQAKHREGETYRYRHYLSYDALLECLALNHLASDAEQARIDAHYTFLGKFLHPTHEAPREFHDRSNVHDGQPRIGMQTRYSKAAVLLAHVYVIHLIADILDEVAPTL